VDQDSRTAKTVQEFERLRGQRITSWTGIKMALREEGPAGGPQFEDPAVPCLQMLFLEASLEDGDLATIDTYQADDVWGMQLRQAAIDGSVNWTGICRMRGLQELPVGEVESVSTALDGGVLAEVLLRIHGQPLLMMADELYERPHERLEFVRLDESVLAFTDPASAESVNWTPERNGLTHS
jgi:hypothetical protein